MRAHLHCKSFTLLPPPSLQQHLHRFRTTAEMRTSTTASFTQQRRQPLRTRTYTSQILVPPSSNHSTHLQWSCLHHHRNSATFRKTQYRTFELHGSRPSWQPSSSPRSRERERAIATIAEEEERATINTAKHYHCNTRFSRNHRSYNLASNITSAHQIGEEESHIHNFRTTASQTVSHRIVRRQASPENGSNNRHSTFAANVWEK